MAIPCFQETKIPTCANGSPRPPQHFPIQRSPLRSMAQSMLLVSRFPARGAPQNPCSSTVTGKEKNADPHRQTEVRLLWTPEFLYVKFIARYRRISVFDDAEPGGRRDKLWDRDVVEVFLQPDPQQPRRYKEFEVSPNGFWIDLEIANGSLQHIKSGLQRRVNIDEPKKTWTAELAVPMKSLTQTFDPASLWRVNFFRVEGPTEPRFYSSWQPTNTPQPNFHVPERFGYLKFEPMPSVKPRRKKISKSKT